MEFNEEVVNQVAALVWDTVADNWADDLARFSAHAGRQKVTMDDIALLTRRNPETLQAACKMAGVEYQETNGQKAGGKGKKRKKEEVPAPSTSLCKQTDEEITVLDENSLHTPKSYQKKPKLQPEEFSRIRVTSTPKTVERTLKFPDEITPIRATNSQSFSSNRVNLSVVEEEQTENKEKEEEEEEQDSFDVFGETKNNDSTKTITNNMSSVLRQAEEYHSSIVEPTVDRLEKERFERMIPAEEFENVSVDSFDNYNTNDDPAPTNKSVGTPKNAVFNNKMSSFAFDDDDSFDEVVEIPKKTLKPSTSSRKKEKSIVASTPKASSQGRMSRTLQLDHDSFDEFDFDI